MVSSSWRRRNGPSGMRRALPPSDFCWLGYCFSAAGPVEAGHQRCCRRLHSGGAEREGRARGSVWQPGCDQHTSRFKRARENGSNVLNQQRKAPPFSVRFSRLGVTVAEQKSRKVKPTNPTPTSGRTPPPRLYLTSVLSVPLPLSDEVQEPAESQPIEVSAPARRTRAHRRVSIHESAKRDPRK